MTDSLDSDGPDGSAAKQTASGPSRREFLGGIGGLAAVSLLGGGLAATPALTQKTVPRSASELPQANPKIRREEAFRVRLRAARNQRSLPFFPHPTNGDEFRYPNKIGSFTKCLPHSDLGEVDPAAWDALIRAIYADEDERAALFEAIPTASQGRLVNPLAAFAFALEGPDSHQMSMAAPPAFASAEAAAEMTELYWQALTRDVPFADYPTDPLIARACADLSRLSDFRGPKEGGAVTPATIFRGLTAGDLVGPYLSQFLWKDVPVGATRMAPLIRTTMPGRDHITTYEEWLDIQRGEPQGSSDIFDPTLRFIRSGRDLAEFVHRDFPYLEPMEACLILLDMGAPLDAGMPYLSSRTQDGFVTFGLAHVLDLVARVSHHALKAAWCQKWLIHRRLRPEAFGGRVHNLLLGRASYPIHTDLITSDALSEVYTRFGSYLLPQAYPEGCPNHPAYPAGHATFMGAGVTVLKAFFDESWPIPSPVMANADGTALVPYDGPALTVGGELNKLASNIGIARDFASIHWRTDTVGGHRLGEAVAIGVLSDLRLTYGEAFGGFSLTKFDGTTVTV
jgi:hypothetical protein